MNKIALLLFLIFNCIQAFTQNMSFNINENFPQNDTIIASYSVFDYFRHEYDSIVYTVGCVYLMPSDSLSLVKKMNICLKYQIPRMDILKSILRTNCYISTC